MFVVYNFAMNRILLLTPFRQNDPRWQTILFTPAALLLASGLEEAGFSTVRRQIALPTSPTPGTFSGFDFIGLTLFEDLASDYTALFEAIRRDHAGPILAGGPMATRLPDTCLGLYPQIDILLRGEAETALPQVLTWITRPGSPVPPVKGLYHRQGDTLFIHQGHEQNRPHSLDGIRLDYNLLSDEELSEGLELNISRGCHRSCLFCCHIQGHKPRRLSPEVLMEHLSRASNRIRRLNPLPPRAMSLNINDDDLLTDPEYARRILTVCQQCGFRLWGLQTAIDSFFDREQRIDQSLIDTVADPALYQDRPLLWLGTDAFLTPRIRRIGKTMPSLEHFLDLLSRFEEKKIRHFHYWISSDHLSDWPEFIEELMLIEDLRARFPLFGLLAHAPFLIPYPDTPLWRLLERDPVLFQQIRFAPAIKQGSFSWRQALRIEPRDAELTRLLDNQPDQGGIRFFDALKENDEFALFNRVYSGLRQARLQSQDAVRVALLQDQEARIEERLGNLI